MRSILAGLAAGSLAAGAIVAGAGSLPATPVQSGAATPELPVLAAPSSMVMTPEVIDCSTFPSENTCTGTFMLRPTKVIDKVLQIKAIVTDPDGTPQAAVLTFTCSGCSATGVPQAPAVSVTYTLTLPGGWRKPSYPRVATGLIGIINDNRFEGTPKRLRITAPAPSGWQAIVVVLPLLAAAIVVGLVAIDLKDQTLDDSLGAPVWQPASSWSSNLTIGAAVVNGVLSLLGTNDLTVFMPKSAYTVTTTLMATLVLLAPVVYGLATGPKSLKGFYAAGLITLWSSGTQLLILALLLGELHRVDLLGDAVTKTLWFTTGIVFLALLAYGRAAMLSTVKAATGAKVPGRENRTGSTWALL
ncbi:MAG: hypothetical protein H0W08_08735 [Acidobacteria bacterium]|nr:hypothetical protein [Acidobacteriota bacterium]